MRSRGSTVRCRGGLQKLYTSYSEASDALSAYAPLLQAAQTKADAALRQAQDAHADLQRATTTANNAAADLKTAQQNQAANPELSRPSLTRRPRTTPRRPT